MASGELDRVIRQVLAPLLVTDGGEVYLVEASTTRVRLHLAGKFAGCPGNTLVKNHVIEPAIHSVAPAALVELTSGAIIPTGAERLS
ncbi:MAG TPA: NifU family protein [Polyangiaceae bacterium]|nr:NifU family protein [Polyangiaceae bacterium]